MNSKQWKRLGIAKLRVKIKSLAEEAAIIREEERRLAGGSSERGHLRHHRITVVRDELRASYLAYAFLRERPRTELESENSKPVDEKRVCKIINSITWNDRSAEVMNWLQWQAKAA